MSLRKDVLNWQPIETAPAAKFEILVAWNNGHMEVMPGHMARDYINPRKEGGCYLTHWMLLPEPPSETKWPS